MFLLIGTFSVVQLKLVGGGIDPHVRAGIDRAANWLADAGYEIVDAEPPQIPEVAATWLDAIWADVGALWSTAATQRF